MKRQVIEPVDLQVSLKNLLPEKKYVMLEEMAYDVEILKRTEIGDSFVWILNQGHTRLIHEKDLSFMGEKKTEKMYIIEKEKECYNIYYLNLMERKNIEKMMKKRLTPAKVVFRSGDYETVYDIWHYQENKSIIHRMWLMDYGHYNHYYFPTPDDYDAYETRLAYLAERKRTAKVL